MKLLEKVLEKFGIFSKEFDEKFYEDLEMFGKIKGQTVEEALKTFKESSETIERKVGEKFDYKGTTLEVVIDAQVECACELCFFGEDCEKLRNISIAGRCIDELRSDNTDVYFKEVTEETELSSKQPEGKKFDTGKPSYTLLPFPAITEVVKILMFGEQKYGRDNWQKVPNARQRYLDACLRHCISYCEGETYDPESGKHHLAHAVCCLLFILWFDLTGKKEEV